MTLSLKAEVSRKHRRLNRGLLCGIGLSLLAMTLASRRLQIQFVSLRQHFSLYAGSLTFTTYLLKNLGREFAKVRILCVDRQVTRPFDVTHGNESCAVDMKRRDVPCSLPRDDYGKGTSLPDSKHFDRGRSDTMQSFLEASRDIRTKPSPSERLSGLLEYLKDYCSDAEFEFLSDGSG